MTITIFIVIFFVLYACVIVFSYFKVKKDRAFKRRNILADHGIKPLQEMSEARVKRASGYYRQFFTTDSLDDITWNDLHLDDVFATMNHTYCAAGEEYLYYTLRNPKTNAQELDDLEKRINFFSTHDKVRATMQETLSTIGYAGKYSVYDYLDFLTVLKGMNAQKDKMMNLLYLACIGLIVVEPSLALVGGICLMIYQIVDYYSKQNIIASYIGCFSFVTRLLETSRELVKIEGLDEIATDELAQMKQAYKSLQTVVKGKFWLKTSNAGAGLGNPLDLMLDYFRMIFHVDIIQFFKMYHHLSEHLDQVWVLMEAIGKLDSAAAIYAYRCSRGAYCVPEIFECMQLENATYPLLEDAIGNSIDVRNSVLITGSNASGKSTFLRTVAINAVLAQTIHTCTCTSYKAPLYRIFSSISIGDDILSGDSYYMAEIKAMKRIMDTVETSDLPVLCFVDEVLRGTNTLERVSASTQILSWIAMHGCTCFAATHDLELTETLSAKYDNYHFTEDVSEGDIHFTYLLYPGKATTRNAIKLLDLLDYPKEVTDAANNMAATFLSDGVWVKGL
ncbi:MAG: hypothetical protein R3Y47_04585 [Lachnospiraceae bacterium]